jgi:hypothetical protein
MGCLLFDDEIFLLANSAGVSLIASGGIHPLLIFLVMDETLFSRLSNRLCSYTANRGNAVISCVFLGESSARYGG